MTVEERLAVLEAFVAKYFAVVTVNDPIMGQQSGLVEFGRRGGNTEFWLRNNVRDGALWSVGNNACRFGLYVENEGPQPNPSEASTAIYTAALGTGSRPNIGIHAIAGNAPDRQGISQNYMGLFEDGPTGCAISIQREGFQLFGGWGKVIMGPAGGPYVTLWPVPKAGL